MAEVSLNNPPLLYYSFIDAVYSSVLAARCAAIAVIKICPRSGTMRFFVQCNASNIIFLIT
jgi:hypothetical protein